MKKGNDKFTISVNEKVKEKFKTYCDKEGLKPGKQVEKLISEFLEENGK